MIDNQEIDPVLDTPHPLPVGLSEFHQWADHIIELAGKFADEESMKYALASQVIHLPHDKAFVPKRWFVNSLRKAAANQVASQVFYDIKVKQEAAKKALEDAAKAAAAQPVEVTTPTPEATSSAPTTQTTA